MYVPVIARNLLESIRLLASACSRCWPTSASPASRPTSSAAGAYAESSPSIGTALNPYLGYEVAAEIVKESARTGKSIREIVKRRKLMTDAQLDRARHRGDDARAGSSDDAVYADRAGLNGWSRSRSGRSSPRSLANLGIALSKLIVFGITGAASMLAEAIHSLADTGNQGLLMLGGARSRKPADELHQFGYSTVRATSGRSWWRSCCSASVGCSRSTRASRSCSTRTRSRIRRGRSGC